MRHREIGFLLAVCIVGGPVALAESPVQFNRDIRPIFSENCFACHGPDESQRMTSLRLDSEAGASVPLSNGGRAIVPGDPASSELFLRVSVDDPVRRMPPAAFGHDPLAQREIELIRQWIEQGGEWQGHWAFLAPHRPEVPPDRYPGWPVNPIDSFVLRRLNAERIEPSPPASRETLIRRVSLDLTGMPPSLAEIDAFLADTSPDAYETVVDQLLSLPRYGERMAVRWLDAARYADTNGYQTDAERYMWRWRDWVIDAFNKNQAFDAFTVEQLAGDMLPSATLDQVIATGFNRNHRGNGEGGIVDAEYAVEYVVDRVDTTATVWLGLTLGCARCHDHKYDPVTQTEYYRLFAYFNNVPEKGKAFKYGNSPPFIKAPTARHTEQLTKRDSDLESLRQQRRTLLARYEDAKQQWATELASGSADWTDTTALTVTFPPDGESSAGEDRRFTGGDYADLGDQANFGFYDRFSVSAWIRPAHPDGAIVSRTGNVAAEEDTQSNPGWGFYLKGGKLQVNLITRWLDDCLRIESLPELAMDEWRHVAFTYDGSRLASGVRIYIDGQPVGKNVIRDEMNQEFKSKEPLRVGGGLGLDYKGQIRSVHVYSRVLTPEQVEVASVDQSLDAISRLPVVERSAAETRKLDAAYLHAFGPDSLTELTTKIRALELERQHFFDAIPTVMVMQEMEPRRKTYRLDRGSYDAPAEEVLPGLPAALSASNPQDRLGFAHWLVSKENPLTARVTVNRIWQMLWGTGIVKTVEDFGSQGEWPTHPELLDWLAVEFMDSGWDIKALVKTIVMSAAYRQSSHTRPQLLERDPENRLMARARRLRLPAESVRDLSLVVSGLVVDTVGGPSVKPYQPAGLWTELAGGEDYEMDSGGDLYRRSLYTFWKRAVPPPSMMLFDSAGREACTVRSVRTNTPLQALNRMNDASYIEASSALARRTLREAGGESPQRLGHMFRLATSRNPSPAELNVLSAGYDYHLARFRDNPEATEALLGPDRDGADTPVSESEMAAYAMMASLVLNLDETITRE